MLHSGILYMNNTFKSRLYIMFPFIEVTYKSLIENSVYI